MKRDLEILSTEELWVLRQKVAATLQAKISAEKKVLEDRLSQLSGRWFSVEQTSKTPLMGISCSWIILAEQLRRLAQIEEEENERRAA
jgi:hypothetical protein